MRRASASRRSPRTVRTSSSGRRSYASSPRPPARTPASAAVSRIAELSHSASDSPDRRAASRAASSVSGRNGRVFHRRDRRRRANARGSGAGEQQVEAGSAPRPQVRLFSVGVNMRLTNASPREFRLSVWLARPVVEEIFGLGNQRVRRDVLRAEQASMRSRVRHVATCSKAAGSLFPAIGCSDANTRKAHLGLRASIVNRRRPRARELKVLRYTIVNG